MYLHHSNLNISNTRYETSKMFLSSHRMEDNYAKNPVQCILKYVTCQEGVILKGGV